MPYHYSIHYRCCAPREKIEPPKLEKVDNTSTKDKFLKEISPAVENSPSKVTMVGAGMVGMAGVFAMVCRNSCNNIALVDARKEAAIGEMMDVSHGQSFSGKRIHIEADSEFVVSRGSKICVITAGSRQTPGESRLDLIQRNVAIFKTIIPGLVKFNPDTILLVVSNPCDIMTWVTWKLSGFPIHRVIGSGTAIDSSRFRYLLSERLDIGAQNIDGYIIGEHGDNSVAVWSSVNVAGTRFKDVFPLAGEPPNRDPENWEQVHRGVVKAGGELIKLKGYTNWAIGLTICRLCETILKNKRSVVPVSTLCTGWNGITEEVFLSIPVILGSDGITEIVNEKLSKEECMKMRACAKTIRAYIDDINLEYAIADSIDSITSLVEPASGELQ